MSNTKVAGTVKKIRFFTHVQDFEPVVEIELGETWEIKNLPISKIDPHSLHYYVKYRMEDLEIGMSKAYDNIAYQRRQIGYCAVHTDLEDQIIKFCHHLVSEFDTELTQLRKIHRQLEAQEQNQ